MAQRIDLRKDVSLTGVTLGGVADIVLTNIALAPFMGWYESDLELQGVPEERLADEISRMFLEDPRLYVLGLALGCAASVVGGYLAGRIAKRNEVLNGALSSFLCVALGIYGFVENPAELGPLEHIAFLILSPALGAFGGMLAARRARKFPSEPQHAALDAAGPPQSMYYAMPPWKLVLLSATSFSFYELFWFYKQWTRVAARNPSEKMRPIWRAVFSIIYAGPLLRRIRDDCRAHAIDVPYRPYLLGALYAALHFAVSLPDPYWLVTFGASLALVPGQNAANALSKAVGEETPAGPRFTKWEWVIVIVGGTVLLLAVIGSFLPPEAAPDPPPGLA